MFVFAGSTFVHGGSLGGNTGHDWPQWRGPNRDGISKEVGLVHTFPEGGPNILWKQPIGTGFSGISVTGGKLLTMYAGKGEEFIVCLDARTGEQLWQVRSDAAYQNQFGNGPRATPTVDGAVVFTLGGQGMLYALNLRDGSTRWQRDLKKDYQAIVPRHGIASSPIVEENLLIVNVGGANGHAFVAFNKNNGREVWSSHDDNPDYSAPIAATIDGVRQMIFLTGSAVVSVAPQTGEVYWTYPWIPQFYNAVTPVLVDGDKLFVSTGAGKGAVLLQVTTKEGKPQASPIWQSTVMKTNFSSSVVQGDYLYGFDNKTMKCINVMTQEEKWAKRGFQQGSLIFADGQFIVLGERGKIALIEATPREYRETAVAKVLRGRCWTVPALAHGILYLRNQKEILAIDMNGAN